jgi:formate/nitrite transporter FocA (FNT family)
MLRKILSGICAGILISIGGTVFLSCENRYIGAVLFSVGLLCICIKGYYLFTGKVGFLWEDHSRESVSITMLALLGNAIGTILCGFLLAKVLPNCGDSASLICTAKLTQQPLYTFVRAVFCGILMYLAVSIYRDKNYSIGILYCIPVFILSGFEHSIAHLFYFACSGIVSWDACGYLWIVIAGNAVGGVLLPMLSMVQKEKQG